MVFIACIIVLPLVWADFYSSRYDDFDIQPLLENDRTCTPDAKDFKKAIPEAVQTTCGRCTPKQKQLIRRVIRAVMESHPDAWNQLVEKYDKDKKYRLNFNSFIDGND